MTGGVDKAGENLRAKWRAVFPPKLMAAAKNLVPPFYPSTAPSLTSAQHAAYFTAIGSEIHLWLIKALDHIYMTYMINFDIWLGKPREHCSKNIFSSFVKRLIG